jgi:hypothetical protein
MYVLGCCSKPPILSTSVIRNLGKELAQIDPDLLTDESLLKKETTLIGSKKSKNKKKKDD